MQFSACTVDKGCSPAYETEGRAGLSVFKIGFRLHFWSVDLTPRPSLPSPPLLQALVPFTNANPHVDPFRMKFRPLVIGSRSYKIQQSMDDRPVELLPLHPGMRWTGAAGAFAPFSSRRTNLR